MAHKKRKAVSKSKSAPAKKSKKKAAPRKRAVMAKTRRKAAKKAASKKALKRTARNKSARANPVRELRKDIQSRGLTPSRQNRGQDAGDLEGLSRTAVADSESVDELLDEGNAFEADAIAGVEEADNADEKEVHTHEVPEDDVPEEYLDEE